MRCYRLQFSQQGRQRRIRIWEGGLVGSSIGRTNSPSTRARPRICRDGRRRRLLFSGPRPVECRVSTSTAEMAWANSERRGVGREKRVIRRGRSAHDFIGQRCIMRRPRTPSGPGLTTCGCARQRKIMMLHWVLRCVMRRSSVSKWRAPHLQ